VEIIEFTFDQIFTWQSVDYPNIDGDFVECQCMYACWKHGDFDCFTCCHFHRVEVRPINWLELMDSKRQDKQYDELVKSIEYNGIVRLPAVAFYKDFFMHYDGHHRMTAAYDLGFTKVPYHVIGMNDDDKWEKEVWTTHDDIPNAWVWRDGKYRAVVGVTA